MPMRIIFPFIVIVIVIFFGDTCLAQKTMHTDLVQIAYTDDAAAKGTSVSDIAIEQVMFDTVKHMFVVTGKVGGLDDNRDDSVYMHIDLMRGGKIFTNYYRSQKDGAFTLSLLSTDKCKLYGLDDHFAFLFIKQPVIKNKRR